MVSVDISKYRGKRVALAFSGGKESILLLELCRENLLDVTLVNVQTRSFSWPEHLRYLSSFRPLTITTKHDWQWLSEHREMLFPKTSPQRNRWFSQVQRYGIDHYARKNNIDVVLWGRRHEENTVKATEYTHNGYLVSHPICNMQRSDVFAEIKKRKLELSPLYQYPDSDRRGVHMWVTRQDEPPWGVIESIEPEIYKEAKQWNLV